MPFQDTLLLDGNTPNEKQDSINRQFTIAKLQSRNHARDDGSDRAQNMFIGFVVFMVIFIVWLRRKRKEEDEQQLQEQQEEQLISSFSNEGSQPGSPLVYRGDSLTFTNETLQGVLQKHFPYYLQLSAGGQEKFINRVQVFIKQKIFVINDNHGFREMPILISASAVQLTFGLENFLLPGFIYINIFPAEFVATEPTMRFLEGNVSGNTINIGWKYLLAGVEDYSDGQNLGVHEMSHALYYQTMVNKNGVDPDMEKNFVATDAKGLVIYTAENVTSTQFFSSYALKNTQEFWAESVELFFEKPMQMKINYPDYYASLCALLKQDPLLVNKIQ